MSEIGCKLFDVFSNQEKLKVLSSGQAFDEEFLEDQRGCRKLRIDLSRETAEYASDPCLSQFWSKMALKHDFNLCKTDGWTDGRTDGRTDQRRPTDGPMDGQTLI